MITGSDMTLFNRYYDRSSDSYKYSRTYIKGVNWQSRKGIDVRKANVKSSDATRIFIPENADTGGKEYVSPKTFANTANKDGVHTFNAEDIVVRGIAGYVIDDSGDFKKLQREVDDVMTITKVADRRFGSPGMHHIELEVR